MKLPTFLQEHEKVNLINYPGLENHPTHVLASRYLENGSGGVLTFGVEGGVRSRSGTDRIRGVDIFSGKCGRREIPDNPSFQHQP